MRRQRRNRPFLSSSSGPCCKPEALRERPWWPVQQEYRTSELSSVIRPAWRAISLQPRRELLAPVLCCPRRSAPPPELRRYDSSLLEFQERICFPGLQWSRRGRRHSAFSGTIPELQPT